MLTKGKLNVRLYDKIKMLRSLYSHKTSCLIYLCLILFDKNRYYLSPFLYISLNLFPQVPSITYIRIIACYNGV